MSKQKPIEEINAAWDDYDRPLPGDLFRHYKGGKYKVVATGFIEETEAPCVIYESLKNNTIWVRTASNFLETVVYEGREMPRFVKLS